MYRVQFEGTFGLMETMVCLFSVLCDALFWRGALFLLSFVFFDPISIILLTFGFGGQT